MTYPRGRITTAPLGSGTPAPIGGQIIDGGFDQCDADTALLKKVAAPVLFGTGVTVTDNANLLAAVTAAGADTTGNNRYVYISGQFSISGKMTCVLNSSLLGQGPLEIRGVGGTSINQTSDNTGILEFQTPNGSSCHGIRIRNLVFTWSNQQDNTDTNSVAIGFRSIDGTSNGGIFDILVEDCFMSGGYRGVATTQTAGQYAIWMVKLEHTQILRMAGAQVYLKSPTSIGQPNIELDHVYCTAAETGASIGGSEPCVQIDGCDSLNLVSVEFNKIKDQTLFSLGGCFGKVATSKLEAGTYTSNTNPIMSVPNSVLFVDGFVFENIALTATDLTFIKPNVGSAFDTILARGLMFNVTSGIGKVSVFSTGAVRCVVLDASPFIVSLGSGPAVVRLQNSGSSTTASFLQQLTAPGGVISDDQGDADVTWTPAMPRTLIFDSPLTANRVVTVSAANGSSNADNCCDSTALRVVRTAAATGAFTLSVTYVTGTVTVAAGASVNGAYRRSFGGLVQT